MRRLRGRQLGKRPASASGIADGAPELSRTVRRDRLCMKRMSERKPD
jgi:hypothetical protein